MNEAERAMREAAILALLDLGDRRAAVTAGLRVYGPEILRYLCRVAEGDAAAAEEMFAIFSEAMWVGVSTFEARSSFRTWAYSLAWSSACRYWRDPLRRRAVELQTRELHALVEQVRTETRPHLKTAAKEWLSNVREALSPEERSLLAMRLHEKLSHEEVGAAMAISPESARKRWSRLKKKLYERAKTARALD